MFYKLLPLQKKIKTMKIELKHLSPYLPYGLKLYDTRIKKFFGSHMDCSSLDYLISNANETVKPILRPLSDLTKEIEHNGEKFVPLQKLCRTIAYNEQYQKDWNFYTEVMFVSNGTQFGKYEKELVYCAWASDSIISREFGYYSESKRFYLKNNRDKICLTDSVNQYLGLEKLFEWHFDVFGLIEIGLAFDINDLN